jgi:hypothetical protein
MNTKYAIFILITSLLTIAVNSSSISISYASAKSAIISTWTCTQVHSTPNVATCTYAKDGAETDYNCTYDTVTKKWSCLMIKTGSGIPNKIPWIQLSPALKNALNTATQSQNGSLVMGQNITQGSNSSQSTINNPPKVSSQSPQTSQSRQTPNTQFGPP